MQHGKKAFFLLGMICLFLIFPTLRINSQDRNLAKKYFTMASNIRKSNPQQALKYYLKAVELRPSSGFYWARVGQHYYVELRDYQNAILYYRKAADLGVTSKWMLKQQVNNLRWLTEINFAASNWEKVRTYINEIDSIFAKYPDIKLKYKQYATRKKLVINEIKRSRVKPSFIHKVLVIMINEVDFYSEKWGLDIKDKLTDRQRKYAKISVNCLANYVNSFTKGNVKLDIEWAEYKTPITNLKIYRKNNWDLDVEKNSLKMGDILNGKLERIDTVILIWPSARSKTARGGATKFLLDNGKKQVWRGVIKAPAYRMIINGPWILVHEFFHVTENMTGIKPRHGFKKGLRSNFPEWQGQGEFNYYRWQFENAIPAYLSSEKFAVPGWRNLNFKSIYKVRKVKKK